ncbi:ABC transporter permease [Paenibacillus mesophilus]|uniref:ABC transporter permease n=1 Tax=Paenibacillus mesophilus TaxID=2582849 RepID=UPI00110DB772|nr:ABC transporter permease subunit [Paenibacillus mesophilus]TMV49322.1 ABC transporter permease [Paenibacillus mesophilus]
MTLWFVLYAKEMKELWRSRKWIWVPLVFVLLGVSQPVTTYYLPDILQAAGSLPEGTVIEIPKPTGAVVLAQTLSQYGTLGVLILILSVMGVVSAERASGAAGLTLVKPVPFASYISAKWAASITISVVSFAAGYASSWYYTELLIGSVAPDLALQSMLLYGLWLAFVVTVTVALSAVLNGSGAIAFLSVGLVALLSVLTGLFDHSMRWSPSTLSGHAAAVLTGGSAGPQLTLALIVTAAICAAMLWAAARLFSRKELLPS